MRTAVLVCAWPRRNTCWKPNGNPVEGSNPTRLRALSSSVVVTKRVSRITNPGTPLLPVVRARSVSVLQAASVDRLAKATPPLTLAQRINPTDVKNGWSSRKLLLKNWSFLLRRLKADPMSAKAANPTVLPMTGMRYSKFPSTCVSAPIGVKELDTLATFAPVRPVKTPTLAADADTPWTCTGVPEAFSATTTLFEVIKVSSGASGVMERTLYPRILNSSPRKKRSKIGTPSTNASEFELFTLADVAKLPTVPVIMRKPKTSGWSDFLRRTGKNCV